MKYNKYSVNVFNRLYSSDFYEIESKYDEQTKGNKLSLKLHYKLDGPDHYIEYLNSIYSSKDK